MQEIDEFIKNYSPEQKAEINRIRNLAKKLEPESIECINYGVPTVKYKDKPLVHFAGYKDHMSLFPGSGAIEEFKPQLTGYELSKGTIKYSLDKPIPEELVRKMLEFNKALIDA